MKKLLQTMKAFLVIAMLCVGTNVAWAEDVYTSVYSRAAVGNWTNSDVSDWNGISGVAVNETNGLGISAASTSTYISKSFSIDKDYKVKYEVDWYYSTSTGRTNNWNWIQFGDFLRIGVSSTCNTQVSTNAGSTWNETSLSYDYNKSVTKHIEVIFDTQLKKVEKFTFGGTDRTALVSGTFTTASFNSVSTGFVRGGSVSWGSNNFITTITVSKAEKEAAAAATYTINYKYGGETILSVAGSSVAGVTIYAESPITISDQRYFAADNATTSKVLVAGANVLDVNLRLPNVYNYSVVARDGSGNKLGDDIASGSYTEGDEAITVAYSQHRLSGTTLYTIGNNGSGDWYRKSFTPNEDNYELTLTYNGSTIPNVVFFTEAENVTNASVGSYTNRASNGQVGYTGSATTYLDATTLAPGKYVIHAKGLNGNQSAKSANFKLGDNVFEFSITQGTDQNGISDEFLIAESSTLSFGSEGHASNGGVDWFYVVKTGERFDVGEEIITNGSFTTNSDGWVLDNYNWHKIQEFNNTCEVESWASNNRPAGSVTQSVGYLPAGNYAISASVLSKAEAYLKVLDASDDSEIASINCTGSKEIDNTVATSFTLNEIKNVKVQFSTPAQEGGPYWSYITNVSMIYYGSETPVVSKMAVSASNIAKYGTFYAPYDVKIPTLIKAYTAQNNAAGTGLTLTEITDGTIPAYTPVILENNRANDNTFNGVFYGLTAAGSQASSALTGTLEEYTLQEGDYIMQYQGSVTAFYPVSGDAIGKKVAANRCYIAAGTEAKAYLTIAPNDVTGVKGVSAEAKNVPMKRIVNGQLIIEKEGKLYNAMGQEK